MITDQRSLYSKILAGGAVAALLLLTQCGLFGGEVRKFEGHASFVCSVSFSPDNKRLVSGGDDKTVRVWDVETGKELHKFEGHGSRVNSVAFSPNGKRIISGSNDRSMRIWDVESGKEQRKFEKAQSAVLSVAFSTNGSFAVSACNNSTRPFYGGEIESGQEVLFDFKNDTGHNGSINSLVVSPDGRRALVAFGGKDAPYIWNLGSGEQIRQLKANQPSVTECMALSPDGHRVLTGGQDSKIHLYDADTGKEIRQLDGHTDWVNAIAFTPDGHRAVSGSRDYTVRVWDIESGKELTKFKGHGDGILSVAVSPNGEYAATGSGDKTIRLWKLPK